MSDDEQIRQRHQLGVIVGVLEIITRQIQSALSVDPAQLAIIQEQVAQAENAAIHLSADSSLTNRILQAKTIVDGLVRHSKLPQHPAYHPTDSVTNRGIVNISMKDNAQSLDPELALEREENDLYALRERHPAYRSNQEEANGARLMESLINAAQSLENDLARVYSYSAEFSEVMDRFCYARCFYGDLSVDKDNKPIFVRVKNVYDAFAVLAAELLGKDDIYDYVEKLEKLIEAAWHYLIYIDSNAPGDWQLDGPSSNHETVVETAVVRSRAIEVAYRGAHELLITAQDAKNGGISVRNSPSGFVLPPGFLECAEQYCKYLARDSEALPPIDLQKMIASIGYFQSENCENLLEQYFESLRRNLAEQARNSGLEWPMHSDL